MTRPSQRPDTSPVSPYATTPRKMARRSSPTSDGLILTKLRFHPPVQKPYVVIAIDPDAITPNLPVFSQVVHLLGGNYTVDGDTGEDGSLPLVNSSAPIAKWRHPIPLVGGAHR